jgi:hypothetical protein
MSENDVEWNRNQSRLKFQRDQNMYGQHAFDKGGVVGVIELCQRILKMPATPRDELVALPFDDLKAMAEALKRQLAIGMD